MKMQRRAVRDLRRGLSAILFGLAIAAGPTISSACAQDTLDSSKPADAKADESPDHNVDLAEVRKLLRQLDSDELAERDEAEKRLIELGPGVTAYLPEISANTSGEMKIRLQRIHDQLQKSDIKTFFQASLVTLKGKMKLAEAIAELSKQTGNKISLANPEAGGDVEVELKADKQPFWEVMDELLEQSHMRINTFIGVEGLSLMPEYEETKTPSPDPSINGPFHVRIVSAHAVLPFGSPLAGQLDIALALSWEPRLKPVYVQLPMDKMKAQVADGGEELEPTNPQAAPEIPLNAPSSSTQIDLQFQRPPRSAKKLEKISGEFIVAIPGEKHKFVFEKFATGKRKSEKFGEVNVILENARRNGSVYEVRILTEFAKPEGALDSFRGWILSNRAYLLDAKQNRLENVGFQTYSISGDAVGVAFLFQVNGDPNDYTLVYESPGMITRQSVPFEIEDVDLP